MRHPVKSFIWYLAENFDFKAPIYDFGSKQSPNQIGESDLRVYFKGKKYIGVDCEKGAGVDEVHNMEKLSMTSCTLNSILCLDTMEHVQNPIQAMKEISRVIHPSGIFVFTSHMYAPWHYEPDYWRFTPQCLRDVLLRDFTHKQIIYRGDRNFPELVGAIASKEPLPKKLDIKELNEYMLWSYAYPIHEFK